MILASAAVNAPLVTGLVIGIPSLIVAIGTYWLSTSAQRTTMQAHRGKVDAEAYIRARELYESAITELRAQAAELRTEVDRRDTRIAVLEAALSARRRR